MTLDDSSSAMPKRTPTWMIWTGRVISAIPILMFVAGGVFALVKPDMIRKGFAEHGWPANLVVWIPCLEIVCGLVYAVPQTAVLGAVLLTGYLGGAVSVHVRENDPQAVVPFILGVLVWLGLFFRDDRIRVLLPWRRV